MLPPATWLPQSALIVALALGARAGDAVTAPEDESDFPTVHAVAAHDAACTRIDVTGDALSVAYVCPGWRIEAARLFPFTDAVPSPDRDLAAWRRSVAASGAAAARFAGAVTAGNWIGVTLELDLRETHRGERRSIRRTVFGLATAGGGFESHDWESWASATGAARRRIGARGETELELDNVALVSR